MDTFVFIKEEKAIIWYKDVYEVKAENKEEAKKIFIEACKSGDESYYDNVELDYSEPIFETYEPLSLEDNNGEATIEIYDEDNKTLIWRNNETD